MNNSQNIKKEQFKQCFNNLKELKTNGIWFFEFKIYGIYKRWYFNNELFIYSFFIVDNNKEKLHGEYKQWYDNGYPWIHTFYNKEELNGEYKQWNRDENNLYKHVFYKNDKSYSIEKAKILFPEGPWLKDSII